MQKIKATIFIFSFLSLFLMGGKFAFGANVFSEDFDSYTANVDITGQGGWTSTGSGIKVNNTWSVSSPNSLYDPSNTGLGVLEHSFSSVSIGNFQLTFRVISGHSSFNSIFDSLETNNNALLAFYYTGSHDKFKIVGNTGSGGYTTDLFTNLDFDTNYNLVIDIDETANKYRVSIDGGVTWSSDITNSTLVAFTGFKYQFQGQSSALVFDNLDVYNTVFEPLATCFDGIQNQDETGIDVGGVCRTHVVDFTPANSETPISSPVTFDLDVFVNQIDLQGILGVKVTLHNIDQNVIILRAFSPSDIILIDEHEITSSELVDGHFLFSSDPQILGDGNYRINVTLTRSYLGGWILNPWSSINEDVSHSFVVGQATFIGTMSNSLHKNLNTLLGTDDGSGDDCHDEEHCLASCVPGTGFEFAKCVTALFVPDGQGLLDTVNTARNGILIRVPWGYLTRTYDILSDSNEVALPEISATFKTSTTDTLNIHFDPNEMLAGASTMISEIHDPLDEDVNFDTTFKPMIKLTISLMVLFMIIMDLTGSHRHHTESSEKGRKLS